ncbi:MAG: peptidase, partial [Verrucomicrobiota bacterium]
MAEPKKKAVPHTANPSRDEPTEPTAPPLDEILSREQLDSLSTLQLIDVIAQKLPARHTSLMDLIYLRDRISEMEEMNEQARQAIEKLDAIVEKLRSPAFRIGTFLMPLEPDRAHVCVGGTDYVCRIDPQIPLASLQIGQRVLCN